jgi:Putative adhesin
MMRWSALAVFLIALAACSGTQVREPFHRSVSTGAAPSVRIDNSVGEIRVTGWQKHSIEIDALKSGMSVDAVRNIDIDVQSQGNTVTIATKYRSFASGGVRYTISLPAGSSLDVNNTTGAIHIDGVDGDVKAGTQTGQVDASVGRVSGRRAIELTATTGSVRLDIDENSDARVDASTTVGDVTSDFPSIGSSRQNVVGASASGTIGRGTATIHLTTTTGSVALRHS